MKNLIFFLAFAVVLFSCRKNNAVGSGDNSTAKTIMNVSYGSDTAQKMDVYLPAGRTDTTPLMIMVHGGAWIVGDKSDFNSYVSIAKQLLPRYAIANMNYRLATLTTNRFPTQENDMKAAVDFLIQKSGDYNISKKFVLLGASAGAHMALLQAYKYSSPKILAVVDFFGPTDMTDLYNFYSSNAGTQTQLQILMNGTPATNPTLYFQSSPINFVSSQSCPTIIFHGTADDVVPIAESTTLKNKLQSFGVVNQMISYQGMGHGYWPDAIMNDAFNKAQVFLNANVH